MSLLWATLTVAWAGAADVQACLDANDVGCARRALDALGASTSNDPVVVALAAETAFYAGDYAEALAQIERAHELGYPDPADHLGLYQRTDAVMAGWAEVSDDRFRVRYRPGVDAILLHDARATLHAAEDHLSPRMGGPPPGPTVLELYPDGASFVDCSSLPEEAVETTGVVALSKWSRLLALSPRALGRGYGWRDTIAHEYIHLVVAHHTQDRAPVWLQEGIARYLDNRWPDGKDHFRLSPRDSALLATALAERAGKVAPDKAEALAAGKPVHVGLLTFDQMHPSLALLPSAELASLAYAQVASLVAYAFDQGGEDVLLRALPDIERGTDARVALAKAAGKADFQTMESDWIAWLSAQKLGGKAVPELATALDGADATASDPVLSRRADLARYMRLGDLLVEAGHADAALIEYAKASDPTEPPSPLLANRVAQAHLALGDLASAKKVLEASLRDYPEFALSHKTLGAVQEKLAQPRAALEAYRRAADLNPFDPDVQSAILRLGTAVADRRAIESAERALRVLRRGGQEPAEVHLLRPPESAK